MQNKKLNLCALLLLVIGLTGLRAQQTIDGSGGNATGTGGTSSYSVGQIVYSTHSGTNGSVAQGVQQPYEISVVIGIEEAKGISLNCSIYPNPTSDFLILKVENYPKNNLTYKLFDINGKLIANDKTEANETKIQMSNLADASYFLQISDGNKELKTFKIIKK
ncbi:MAG: T9SS type A sorting domain-containing protein [Bacteroidota bacterium]